MATHSNILGWRIPWDRKELDMIEQLSLSLWQNVPLISPIFLKRSLVFPLLLFSSSFIHCSLKKSFLYLCAIFWKSAFSWIYLSLSPLLFACLLSLGICKSSSDNNLAFSLFFFWGMVLFSASCTILWTSVHSFSGTLFINSNPLNLIPSWITSL